MLGDVTVEGDADSLARRMIREAIIVDLIPAEQLAKPYFTDGDGLLGSRRHNPRTEPAHRYKKPRIPSPNRPTHVYPLPQVQALTRSSVSEFDRNER